MSGRDDRCAVKKEIRCARLDNTYKRMEALHTFDDGRIHLQGRDECESQAIDGTYRRNVDDDIRCLTVMLMLKSNTVISGGGDRLSLLLDRGLDDGLDGRNRLLLHHGTGVEQVTVVRAQTGIARAQRGGHLQRWFSSMSVVSGIILHGYLVVSSDVHFHRRGTMNAATKRIHGFGITAPALTRLLI